MQRRAWTGDKLYFVVGGAGEKEDGAKAWRTFGPRRSVFRKPRPRRAGDGSSIGLGCATGGRIFKKASFTSRIETEFFRRH